MAINVKQIRGWVEVWVVQCKHDHVNCNVLHHVWCAGAELGGSRGGSGPPWPAQKIPLVIIANIYEISLPTFLFLSLLNVTLFL